MADRNDAAHARLEVDRVQDSIASDAISPLSFELASEWNTVRGVDAQYPQGRSDAALQVGREAPNHIGDLGRDREREPPATGGFRRSVNSYFSP
jgi:hypothetical protein